MRVSAPTALHTAATGNASAGTTAADSGFAALLSATLPEAELASVAQAPMTVPLLATEEAGTGEEVTLASSKDSDTTAALDPALLALLSDARAMAANAVAPDPGKSVADRHADEGAIADAGKAAAAGALSGQSTAASAPHEGADLPTPAAKHKGANQMPVDAAAMSMASRSASQPAEAPALPQAHQASTAADPQPGVAFAVAANHVAPAVDSPAKPATIHLNTPTGTDRWGQAFGEQVLWMAQKDVQAASLTLNPPELGPVKIELQLNDAQAVASFSSAVPEVRKAIEDALPALKTMFADAGLDLRQADVGSGNARPSPQDSPQHRDDPHAKRSPTSGDRLAVNAPAVPATRVASRLLDTFA